MRRLALIALALTLVAGAAGCRERQPPPASVQAPAQPPAAHVTQRPPVMGRNAGVSTGHPLATAAALELLTKGGNAFDAGVAAMLVSGVEFQASKAHPDVVGRGI